MPDLTNQVFSSLLQLPSASEPPSKPEEKAAQCVIPEDSNATIPSYCENNLDSLLSFIGTNHHKHKPSTASVSVQTVDDDLSVENVSVVYYVSLTLFGGIALIIVAVSIKRKVLSLCFFIYSQILCVGSVNINQFSVWI